MFSTWALIEQNSRFRIVPTTARLALNASRAVVESNGQKRNDMVPEQWAYFQKYSEFRCQGIRKPGLVIAHHILVKGLDQILNDAYGPIKDIRLPFSAGIMPGAG